MSVRTPRTKDDAKPMARLPFALHDFTRVAWVNEEARAVWAKRISDINKMHAYLEWASVAAGIRKCGLQMLDKSQLTASAINLGSHGLELKVLKRVGAVSHYQSRISEATSAEEAYWCAIGKGEHIAECHKAFDDCDNVFMGRLLGYPECCIEYFQDFWVEKGLVDSTWLSALNTSSAVVAGALVSCNPSKCSVLLRWIGVRAVFHLPCAFDCAMSDRIAEKLARLAQSNRFANEARWLSELMVMPMEWSALHGIAEVKTPLFKIVTNTDATAEKHVVRIEGTEYPAQGASGVVFPFRVRQKEPLQRFQSALAFVELNVAAEGDLIEQVHFTDNGFTTKYAMDRAHSPLVSTCHRLLSELGNGKQSVLDLGCGNGLLLRRVAEGGSHVAIAGIDCDHQKIERAIDFNRAFDSKFVIGDMFDVEALERHFGSKVDVCVVMLGRLTEVDSKSAVRLLAWIEATAGVAIAYAYTDYFRNGTSLTSLADSLGIQLGKVIETDTVSLATIAKGTLNE